jgi:hypothetical protein
VSHSHFEELRRLLSSGRIDSNTYQRKVRELEEGKPRVIHLTLQASRKHQKPSERYSAVLARELKSLREELQNNPSEREAAEIVSRIHGKTAEVRTQQMKEKVIGTELEKRFVYVERD